MTRQVEERGSGEAGNRTQQQDALPVRTAAPAPPPPILPPPPPPPYNNSNLLAANISEVAISQTQRQQQQFSSDSFPHLPAENLVNNYHEEFQSNANSRGQRAADAESSTPLDPIGPTAAMAANGNHYSNPYRSPPVLKDPLVPLSPFASSSSPPLMPKQKSSAGSINLPGDVAMIGSSTHPQVGPTCTTV